MSYLWQEFNIKTFPAQTLVFRDGAFCEDLSEYPDVEYLPKSKKIIIDKYTKLPVHIIYVGEINTDTELNIDINAENTGVFMDFKVTCEKPAFLNIFIKNTGKNSVFTGKIIVKNHNKLKINVYGEHLAENTGIFVKTRVAAYKKSETSMRGVAKIGKNIPGCESDISFSAIADENAFINMQPVQFIQSEPKNASHSAALYKPNKNQIYYLKTAGMSDAEIKQLLDLAFLEEE